MIWSVSTSERSSGTAVPVIMRTASISRGPPGWRSGRRRRWRRRRRGRRGGCARPGPGGPRSCGCSCDAHRSPGASLSGFMRQAHRAARLPPVEPGGDEHPVEALGLGLGLHRVGAGHDQRPHPGPTCRPSATAAAARRSSMRLLVHDPMNTVSTAMSRIGVPAVRPMYASARAAASRSVGVEEARRGRGRRPSIGTTCDGFVPQETWGVMVGAVEGHLLVEGGAVVGGERPPVVERRAPRPRPSARAAGPRGRRRSCRRGRSSPARAPASIDMLHTVMRPSIESDCGWPSRGTR